MKYTAHDELFSATCPTVIVPKFGEFEPLQVNGHRFLCARDGLWVEVRRPWLSLIWPVALQEDYAMPYGALERRIDLSFGKIPPHLIESFIADAEANFPNEFGAWLVWDDNARELVYRPLRSIKANGAYLEVERPTLADHESLAVDLHCHGRHPAFFSSKDDEDDKNEVKIAGVYGSLGRGEITKAFRLCTGGRFINFNI